MGRIKRCLDIAMTKEEARKIVKENCLEYCKACPMELAVLCVYSMEHKIEELIDERGKG